MKSRITDMAIDLMDKALMLFYRHTQHQSRRMTRLVVTLLPLMVLLVGSCKTSQLPWVYGTNAGSEQFRMALFPDRVTFKGDGYFPAAGYLARAKSFIEGTPDAVMLLTQEEIGYIFGKPSLHRQDANAEVWQYKTDACVVDFYFYNDKGHGQSQLSYIDIRTKAELSPGSKLRTLPLSQGKKSDCLHNVAGSFSGSPA